MTKEKLVSVSAIVIVILLAIVLILHFTGYYDTVEQKIRNSLATPKAAIPNIAYFDARIDEIKTVKGGEPGHFTAQNLQPNTGTLIIMTADKPVFPADDSWGAKKDKQLQLFIDGEYAGNISRTEFAAAGQQPVGGSGLNPDGVKTYRLGAFLLTTSNVELETKKPVGTHITVAVR